MRGQRGQASIEVMGMLPVLLVVAMFVWQLHLAMSAATSVENAARTASRVDGLGGDAKRAAMRSLPGGQREGAEIVVRGGKVEIRSRVPTIVPGLSVGFFHVNGSADLPG